MKGKRGVVNTGMVSKEDKGHTLAICIDFRETTLNHAPLLFLESLGAVHARSRGGMLGHLRRRRGSTRVGEGGRVGSIARLRWVAIVPIHAAVARRKGAFRNRLELSMGGRAVAAEQYQGWAASMILTATTVMGGIQGRRNCKHHDRSIWTRLHGKDVSLGGSGNFMRPPPGVESVFDNTVHRQRD